MSHPNNTPEQKAAWKANQRLGSHFINIIPSDRYNPWPPKAPSKRDLHRIAVAERKHTKP